MRVGVVERAAVVRAQDEEAHHLGVVLLQHLADGEEVAQRLRHLLVVDAHEAVVHPVIDEGVAVRALGLGDLVLVVGELQVHAAAVDVEVVAEQVRAHRRALDVPARAALAPRRRPLDLARLLDLGVLPQHEVERVVLVLRHVDALAGAQLVERLARQLAVAVELAHRVAHVAVGGDVGQALLLETRDQRLHLRHVVGGARLVVGAQHAERVGVLVHRGDEAVGELADALAVLLRAADDLVVDVGDVAHVDHVEPARAQPARDHVEHHHHARMAEVAEVVHRHAAHVHADLAGFDGREGFLAARQGVVDGEHRADGSWLETGHRRDAGGGSIVRGGACC